MQYNLHCSYDPMRIAYATAVLIDRGAQPANNADQPRFPAMSSMAFMTPICGLSGECWWLVCVCVLITSNGIVAQAARPPAAAPAVEFTNKTCLECMQLFEISSRSLSVLTAEMRTQSNQ